MITITESGMTFGPFDPDRVFRIEESAFLRGKQLKACEFVWLTPQDSLLLIEAKSSVPNPHTSPKEYDEFFTSIFEKLDNSLQILAAGLLERHNELTHQMGPMARVTPLGPERRIMLYLVIPEMPDEYLPPFSDKLASVLKRQGQIWRAEVKVINKRLAGTVGLVDY
ncbi:hypothetical protein [Oceanobacter antarcticus]|uniref:Uncharacterized protein n=1 Tax=Oceanobacter antarcticus TaxID=3133425 RepID=A0ABW8NGP3_9GAMM